MTTSQKSLRVSTYARVSKANRSGATTSVDEQLATLHAAIATHGGTLVADHVDRAVKASGTARHRPGWDALLADIEADKVDAVALWEISRSSRRLAEFANFRDMCVAHEVLWLLPDGLVDPGGRDRLSMGVKAVVAEQEVDDLTKRIRRTVASRAADGKPHGREVYGYRRIYSPATGALVGVEVHPEEAEILRRLVDGILSGTGLRTLGRALDVEGVPCPTDAIRARRGREPKGLTWTGRVIREMVVRRTYLGRRVHESRVGRRVEVAEYAACWPALITEEEHTRLVRILSDPARWTRPDDGGRPEVRHWLSGVLRCGKCGSRMRRMSARGAEAYVCNDPRCRGCSVNLSKAQAAVESVVLARLGLPDALEGFKPLPVEDPAIEARAEVKAAEDLRTETAEAYAAGLLSLAAYSAADRGIEARIEAASALLRAAETPGLPDFAVGLLDPAAAWASWTPPTRHLVAAALFDRIIVKPIGRGRPPAGSTVMPRLGFVWSGTIDPVWGDDKDAA